MTDLILKYKLIQGLFQFPRIFQMSRSIMLNGVKATIIFHDTTSDNPNDKPTINWELVIESTGNKAMIEGSITMDVKYFDTPTPHTTPVIQPVIEPIKQEIPEMPEIKEKPELIEETLESFNDYISKSLSIIASTKNRKEKASITTIMFKYMMNALHFVKSREELKMIAIDRVYHIKENETAEEFPELFESLDAFLVALGEPLEPASEYNKDDKKYEQDDKKYEQDEYIDECGYRWPKFVGNVDKHKDDSKRSILLKKLFEEENLTFKMEYMNWYYSWEEVAPKLNRYQKMKAFINSNKHALIDLEDKENDERKKLIVSIFKKKNLEFKDVYMDMYYEWQKNAPKENRYKKMCSFIDVQGFK